MGQKEKTKPVDEESKGNPHNPDVEGEGAHQEQEESVKSENETAGQQVQEVQEVQEIQEVQKVEEARKEASSVEIVEDLAPNEAKNLVESPRKKFTLGDSDSSSSSDSTDSD